MLTRFTPICYNQIMRFQSKLRRVGNSVGITIPKQLLVGRQLGEEVEFEIQRRDKRCDSCGVLLNRQVFCSPACKMRFHRSVGNLKPRSARERQSITKDPYAW